ncbi:hypothetical protein ABZS66_52560 [Dactylosporangium sp. NPDC005572]|uniref:hypothetical protein n=1 Tax=Dactylosporangium sp. NPDC005572 TaxID=3156889 RepID=UPI0033B59E40
MIAGFGRGQNGRNFDLEFDDRWRLGGALPDPGQGLTEVGMAGLVRVPVGGIPLVG